MPEGTGFKYLGFRFVVSGLGWVCHLGRELRCCRQTDSCGRSVSRNWVEGTGAGVVGMGFTV